MPFKESEWVRVCSMRLPLWEFNLKILHCINIWNDGYQLYHCSLFLSEEFEILLSLPCVCLHPDIRLTMKYVIVMRISRSLKICIYDNESNYLLLKRELLKMKYARRFVWRHLWIFFFMKEINGNLSHANAQRASKPIPLQIVSNCAKSSRQNDTQMETFP